MGKTKESDPVRELARSFARWEEVYQNGCSDPFWPDGVNLNLIRNHIISYKKRIEEKYPREHYPEIYYRETPSEVSQDYMARSEEIRRNAQKALHLYTNHPNYKFLLSRVETLSLADEKKLRVHNVLHYICDLEGAIGKDDLVTMRQHERPAHYVDAIEQCANKVRALGPPVGQLSIFDAIAAAQERALDADKSNRKQEAPDRVAR